MKTRRLSTLLLAVAAVGIFGSACTVELLPMTDPPPTRQADVDNSDYDITIHQGVALAVECNDDCDGLCKGARVTSGSSDVLTVMSSYRVTPDEALQTEGARPVFVLVGKRPGRTTLSVESSCTDDEYDVRVLSVR